MATFIDNRQRERRIELVLQTAIDLQQQAGVELAQFGTPELLERLTSDYALLGKILWVCVVKFPDETPEDFVASLGGDALETATDALFEAVKGFFPKARREVFALLMRKGKEVEHLAAQQALKALERLSAEQILTWSANASSSADSSDSIPAPSPIASSTGLPAAGGATPGPAAPSS